MYYGCDSNSDAVCSNPPGQRLTFYLGELGYGDVTGGAFNASAAAAANQYYIQNGVGGTYGYWFLYGPTVDPRYDPKNPGSYTKADAYAWGQTQGADASSAWNNNQYVIRTTLFGDVEGTAGTNGWLNQSDMSGSGLLFNQAVWEGFFNNVNASGPQPGAYTAPDAWTSGSRHK